MEQKNNWIPFQDIDWDNPNFNKFSIDTRDFYTFSNFSKEIHPDIKTLLRYKDFFLTKEELLSTINRYFIESGGPGKWRMFSLEDSDNWNLKYLRIFKTNEGFLICDSNEKALRKTKLNLKVNQKYLNFIEKE